MRIFTLSTSACYQGAAQVFADGEKRCRFVWTVGVLLNEQMELAVRLMMPALEKA